MNLAMHAELFSHGGAGEVTGSKHFLGVDGQTVMVDCGAFQGRRAEAEAKNRNWPFQASDIAATVLSHAHYDHCGALPRLPRNGFSGNIYATAATRDLTSLVLRDSAHIQAKDLEFLAKRGKKRGEPVEKQPLYTEHDVTRVMDHFVTVAYHRPFALTDRIRATFYDAGHILGSAVTVLEAKSNGATLAIGFSGDLGRRSLPILRDPEVIPAVDFLVMESTYGNRLHAPIDKASDALASAINETAQRGGKVIIPAFAVERTQELIYLLNQLGQKKLIPKLPVYVDSPMAANATAIFQVHQECFDDETRETFLAMHKDPFGFDDLHYVASVAESKRLNSLRKPAIIISSSGMCEAGRILHHLLNNIENEKNTILVVGYMAENTLGRKIVEGQREISIFGETRMLKTHVKVLNTFSGHADYNDILTYVGGLDRNRLRRIFLVHGEADAQAHLKGLLEQQRYAVTIVRPAEHYPLLS